MTEEESQRWFHDSLMWTKYIPRAWRAVAGDYVGETFPSWLSTSDEGRWKGKAHGVFTAYCHLLRYRLGWSSVPQGLVAWDRLGRPGGDPVLELMLQLGGDGVDWFIGWAAQAIDAPADEPARQAWCRQAG